ncbi:MAG: hypothetical protein ACLP2F_14050, partial [Steroidobacteraceae bacterium]
HTQTELFMNDPHSRATRLDRIGIFRTAMNPSVEAAGKTCDAISCIAASRGSPLRCAVPASRKPGVAIRGHPCDACAEPCFSRSGNTYPIQPFSSFSVVHE